MKTLQTPCDKGRKREMEDEKKEKQRNGKRHRKPTPAFPLGGKVSRPNGP